MMRETCVFAVSGERKSCAAISSFVSPCATSRSTSTSRSVSAVERGRIDGILHSRRRPLEQSPRHTGGEERLAGGDDAHRADEIDGLGVLHEESARAGADRARDVLVELEGRDDDDLDRPECGVGGDLLGGPESVAVRHPDVQQCHVDGSGAERAQQLLAAGCLGDDLDVGLGVQQRPESGAHELVVVGERDADHDGTRQGR